MEISSYVQDSQAVDRGRRTPDLYSQQALLLLLFFVLPDFLIRDSVIGSTVQSS